MEAVCVRGNHDRYLTDLHPDDMYPSDRIAHRQLNSKHLEWLRGLPATSVFEGVAYICHATPTDDNVYWLEEVAQDGSVHLAAIDDIEERAEGIPQPLILCGHSHIPRSIRLRDGRMIVNPGSVGCPGYRDTVPYPHVVETGTPDASYAILELRQERWHVTFRHVPYRHLEMAELARRNGRDEWANALATGWISASQGENT
jgi:diadenosine tetraphosphatase ApaH/serine/threonine PP2A family protein phosphatase